MPSEWAIVVSSPAARCLSFGAGHSVRGRIAHRLRIDLIPFKLILGSRSTVFVISALLSDTVHYYNGSRVDLTL